MTSTSKDWTGWLEDFHSRWDNGEDGWCWGAALLHYLLVTFWGEPGLAAPTGDVL